VLAASKGKFPHRTHGSDANPFTDEEMIAHMKHSRGHTQFESMYHPPREKHVDCNCRGCGTDDFLAKIKEMTKFNFKYLIAPDRGAARLNSMHNTGLSTLMAPFQCEVFQPGDQQHYINQIRPPTTAAHVKPRWQRSNLPQSTTQRPKPSLANL
jgi:hypothetical protein